MFQMGVRGDLAKHIALNSVHNEDVPNTTHPLISHYIFPTIVTSIAAALILSKLFLVTVCVFFERPYWRATPHIKKKKFRIAIHSVKL